MTSNTPRTKPKHMGEAQWRFVLKIRSAIANDPRLFFKSHNWRCISPTTGGRHDSSILDQNAKKTTVEHFYVKSMATWVPHLLVPNHTPCCPHCKTSRHVDIVKSRWVNCPKVLYGMSRYRYLDTVLYPCTKCGRQFAGYNKQSMQLDSSLYYGFFTFYLGHGFAVDDDLHRFVIEAASIQSTASIAKRLTRMAYDAYYEEHLLYLTAIGLKKIRPKKKQKSIAELMPRQTTDPELQRLLNNRARRAQELTKAKLAYSSASQACTTDWAFKSMLQSKDNHNVHGRRNFLAGLGSTKLRKLMARHINSCFQLIGVDPREFPEIKPLVRWQTIVENYYDGLKLTESAKKRELESAQLDFDEALDALVAHEGTNNDGEVEPRLAAGNNPNDDLLTGPETFSEFKDKAGYGGRILSKYRVDSMVMTVFNHRREFQELKMRSLTAHLLKIDFNYKLATKIRVWTKRGQSFSPFKCIVTVHNEDGLTVFWKALKHSESFKEIEQDLVRLRNRLNRNRNAQHSAAVARKLMADKEGNESDSDASEESEYDETSNAVKVLYIDNCCNVKNILRRIFPDALIKLDPFHWLKRWNELMVEPSSAEAGVFRGLMSRAIFNIEPTEYERAKDKVCKKKKRDPTVKEILKEANAVIPSPEVLRRNVEAVFHYVQTKDTDTMRVLCNRRDDDSSPKPKLFMKQWKIADVFRNQLQHVDLGCLSDPDPNLVNIFRRNTLTDVTYVSRGTNTNERDNVDLASNILTAAHIGK